MEEIIKLVDLTRRYGKYTAVNNLNLSIKKGEIFGLLGPNGAGKSTTILMMLGLTEPTSGFVEVCGINPTTNPVAVKRKVGYLPEDVGFYDDRTGLENLIYTARLNGIKDAEEKAAALLDRVDLSDAAHKKTGKYSRGMRQRLGLADVLIKDPEVVILDEPTLGIDPEGVRNLLQLILQLSKEEGLTVLLSSHHLHQVQQVCDRVGLFVRGNLIAEGDMQTLSRNLFANEPLVIEAGVSALAGRAKPFIPDELKEAIKSIDGVVQVNADDHMLRIGCSRDASADIARTIVQSGAGLSHLVKKEYGLDEIYHRYFEGGENHE